MTGENNSGRLRTIQNDSGQLWRQTLDWEQDGKRYQARTEGRRILWVRTQVKAGEGYRWRNLQLHGPTVQVFAERHGLAVPTW